MLRGTDRLDNNLDIGVYLHIPYCRHMCHYCDFAKTANWSPEKAGSFFQQLELHCHAWIRALLSYASELSISSLNVGGGTPSLFVKEYARIFAVLRPYLSSDCEVSLEANPDDITPASLSGWKNLGFNRISLGIQTFHACGLRLLKRSHSASTGQRSLLLAGDFFDNLNADLIYSWPGQSRAMWQQDLKLCQEAPLTHLSLYNLTYAEQTPIGRAWKRGRLREQAEAEQEGFYNDARTHLANYPWVHEEVSNWALPGYQCQHNLRYWQGGYYLGIGPGAHGYLPAKDPVGLRYSYDPSERSFRISSPQLLQKQIDHLLFKAPYSGDPRPLGGPENRNRQSWFLEYLGCGLRCKEGLDLSLIRRISGLSFRPDGYIRECLGHQILKLDGGRLTLAEPEWFRETAWCMQLAKCFVPEGELFPGV